MLIQRHWLRFFVQNSTSIYSCRLAAVPGNTRGRCLVQPAAVRSTSTADPEEPGKARRKRQQKPKTTKASGRGQVQDVQGSQGSKSIAESAADAHAHAADTSVSNQAAPGQTLSDIVPVTARGQPNFPDAPFRLRPYQLDAIHNVIRTWKKGSNAQMVMLPTGCGKTVVFAALARYMAQHYVHTAAADKAATVPNAGAAPAHVDDAAGVGGLSTQHRGGPSVAAASTEGIPTAEAGQLNEEGSGHGDSLGYSSGNSGTSSSDESMSEAASDENAVLLTTPGRLQRVQQALKGGTNSKSTQSLRDGSSTSSRTSGKLQDGRMAVLPGASSASRTGSTSPSTPNNVSSTTTSSSEDEGGGKRTPGKRRKARKQQSQQEQQPEVQQQVAPAGSMRVLVLAHRHELLHQAEEKFRLMWGAEDLTVSWVKGKRKEFEGQVVVASAATAVNCIPALRECNFSLVVVDEAHHTVANTYKTILEGLGFIEEVPATPSEQQSGVGSPTSSRSSEVSSTSASLDSVEEAEDEDGDSADATWRLAAGANASESEDGKPKTVVRVIPNPNQLLLGFTATPYRLRRSESEDLYAIFCMSYAHSISDMIRDRYLTEIKSQKILTQTDLKGAGGGSKGDFIISKLSPLVNSRTRNKLVLAAYLEHCTEPAEHGPGRTMQQHNEHQHLSEVRARHVGIAFATKARQKAAKEEEKLQQLREMQEQLRASSVAAAQEIDGDDSAYEGDACTDSFDSLASLLDDDSEEEEELLMWPLPEDVMAPQITGGLSMAGRKAVRKTVAFAVDIKHAEAMNAVFNAAGVRASAIHSLMPFDILKSELARFRAGDLEVLFNVEVLTEGFDEPSIDAILMARPTKSVGLYTQMLGRGLRIMPGKTDCLVLDFTDKNIQAGKVVDLRVLLDEVLPPSPGAPAEKGPARIDENAQGGEVDVVERELDPKDLAWRNMGPHCMASIFSSGNVWLVNVADMGPTQRDTLGLVAQSAPVQRRAQLVDDTVLQGVVSAEDEEDSDDDDSMEDRYIVLHQDELKNSDPISWRVAYTPQSHTWKGFSKEDAYGAALAYIDTFVRKEQARAVYHIVRAKRTGQKPTKPFIHLNSFKQDAPWRTQPASDRQLQLLKQLAIRVGKALTKGEASDLISAHKCGLAEPAQLLKLQEALGPKEFEDLPIPLLKTHANDLLQAAEG